MPIPSFIYFPGKYHYYGQSDEFFLATIPRLSAICRSSTNVDMCDRKFQVSYLVKYIGGHEEHRLVDVSGSKHISEVDVRTEDHAHEKISSCATKQAKKEAAKPHLGREVSLAEVIWFVLGFRYTFCTSDFVHISTLPLENRSAVLQSTWHRKAAQPQTAEDLKAVVDRRNQGLPAWRLFTDSQVAHVEDYLKSPYYIDITSSFNIRPPELRFFDNLSLYAECFVTVGKQPCLFTNDLRLQPWYDALSRRIKLRASSITKATAYVMEKFNAGDPFAMRMLNAVFIPATTADPETLAMFIDLHAVTDFVAVTSFVKPWDKTKFLYHLCLTLGHYDTEIDLFCNANIRLVFEKAGLVPSSAAIERRHVLDILRQYVLTDLRFHPISARQFGRYLKAAMRTLSDALIDDTLGDYTPCLSNVSLKDQASEILKGKETERKAQLIASLMDDPAICDIIPADLILSTLESPRWDPEILEADGISAEAISEQRAALRCCTDAVDLFLTPSCCGLKFPCLVGRAGSGKTHVMKLATAYALSRGLQVSAIFAYQFCLVLVTDCECYAIKLVLLTSLLTYLLIIHFGFNHFSLTLVKNRYIYYSFRRHTFSSLFRHRRSTT